MITNVTIICTNLSKNILNNYNDYNIIEDNFTYEELLRKKKVIFFNVLSSLKEEEIIKLYNFLNINSVLFINVTNNIEESLYTDKLFIYDNEKIIVEGKSLDILQNEKLIKRLGFKIPFIINLSILLKDYNLINKIYFDKTSLVGDLWI